MAGRGGPAIPERLHGEVQRLHRGGLGYKAIAEHLRVHHGVECSHMAVSRLLERLQGAPPAPPPEPEPDGPPLPRATPPTDEENLLHWKRKAHKEAVAAERFVEDDPKAWQRYHSAMRLIATFDAAIDKKKLLELELGDGSGRVPLSADEEAAALEAARQAALSTYELQDPSTLDIPQPGAPLPEGTRTMAN